jgi:tetratricopeptide (TPR) repeat protein
VASAAAAAAALASALAWGLFAGPALPKQPNVAVLAPKPSGDAEFDAFALGGIELVNDRLRKLTTTHSFQLASYSDGLAEKVATAADARRVLGANLALVTSVTQAPNVWRVQLDLVETGHNRRLASRTVVVPVSEPFQFLDGASRAANEMLRLRTTTSDSSAGWGIRGAGTLRFYLQGLGRRRLASTPEAALASVADLEVACRTEPQGAVARAGLAAAQMGAYRATKDSTWLTRATASAREAVRLDPSRAEPHRVLAALLETAKRNSEAVTEYARQLQLDPSDNDARLRMARNYAHMGQPERELQCYQEATELRPIDWQPWWWLSTWNFRRGDTDGAIRCYRELIRRAPLLYRGYASLGGLLVLEGNYDAAIDSLKLSIALRPTNDAFANLGTAYFNTGRFESASDAYNQAFQFGDADYVSWLNLGDAYYFLRDRKNDANAAYAQSVRLGCDQIRAGAARGSPLDVRIAANVAVLFARLAQPDSARFYLALAVQADTSNSIVGYCAALTYWQFGEKGRAMEWLAQAVRQGYPRVWLKDSPVFREWRGIPEFRALVGETEPGPKAAAARS